MGDIFSVSVGPTISSWIYAIFFMFLFSILCFIIYAAYTQKWIFKRFPIPIVLFKTIGNHLTWDLDKGRIFKKENNTFLELKKTKVLLASPPLSQMLFGDRMVVYQTTPEEIVPAKVIHDRVLIINNEGEEVEVPSCKVIPLIPPELKASMVNRLKEEERRFKYETFLQKFAPYVLFGMAIIFALVLFYIIADKFVAASSSLSSAAENFAKAYNATYIPPIPK